MNAWVELQYWKKTIWKNFVRQKTAGEMVSDPIFSSQPIA